MNDWNLDEKSCSNCNIVNLWCPIFFYKEWQIMLGLHLVFATLHGGVRLVLRPWRLFVIKKQHWFWLATNMPQQSWFSGAWSSTSCSLADLPSSTIIVQCRIDSFSACVVITARIRKQMRRLFGNFESCRSNDFVWWCKNFKSYLFGRKCSALHSRDRKVDCKRCRRGWKNQSVDWKIRLVWWNSIYDTDTA